MYVNKKVQLDATVCRHLFTAKSLYMFRASQHPSSGALKTVTATSGIGHNTGISTSSQRGLVRTLTRPRWKEVASIWTFILTYIYIYIYVNLFLLQNCTLVLFTLNIILFLNSCTELIYPMYCLTFINYYPDLLHFSTFTHANFISGPCKCPKVPKCFLVQLISQKFAAHIMLHQ